jgi:Flp pilus assembly secretin CpaC
MCTRLPASYQSWLFYCALVFIPSLTGWSEEPTDELQKTTPKPAPKRLLIELKVIEVNLDKMKKLGFEWSRLTTDGSKQFSAEQLVPLIKDHAIPADQFDGFLRALHHNGLARVIAEPTLITLDGRPASLVVGPTRLDVVPIVLASGRVKLECRLKTSELAEITTDREMELGKRCLLRNTQMHDPRLGLPSPQTEIVVLASVDLAKSGQISKVIAQPTDVEVRDSEIRFRHLHR